MIGGGGGGSGLQATTNAIGRAGGGCAEWCMRVPVILPAGGTVSVVIGAGGAGGDASGSAPGSNGKDGGASTFLNYTVNGGHGSTATTAIPSGGDGGGISGIVQSLIATQPAPKYEVYGFTGGGAGGTGTGGTANRPSPSLNGFVGTTPLVGARPGSEGAPSPWGNGGLAGNTAANGNAAASTSYGAGGGGCGGTGTPIAPYPSGGAGADGYALVEWIG
jgi:hypothetical protein